MSCLYRRKIKSGHNRVIAHNKHLPGVSFSVLRLPKGGHFVFNLIRSEAALVVLGGTIRLTDGDSTYTGLGRRPNPFSGKAFSVYMRGKRKSYGIKAESATEAVIIEHTVSRSLYSREIVTVIPPHKVSAKTVGKKNWQRKVYTIIPPAFPAGHMLVGETINPPGNWSSVPPHKHDSAGLKETKHKEIYYFKVSPQSGFGLQRLYDNKRLDETYTIKDSDTVVMPSGYHPVVASPGHMLYYIWVLIGEERTVKMTYDNSFKMMA